MKKAIIILFMVLFLSPMLVTHASATAAYKNSVNSTCGMSIKCNKCHLNKKGGGELTADGQGYVASGYDACYFCPGAPGCGGGCPDADNDGYDDEACGGTDCNDNDNDIHPGATEIECDGIDQDCSGSDSCPSCDDADNDGYDDEACGGTDCDDSDNSINPGATEIECDGIDQDCDGSDYCPGTGCSTYGDKNSCNVANCCKWNKQARVCEDDTSDPGCGGGCPDDDNDGYDDEACGGTDCDDTDNSIHPGATEIECDGIDQDCSGSDSCPGCPDADNDGYDDEACGGTDCDDTDNSINPGATEIECDGIDQDCSGSDSCPAGDENCKDGIDNDGDGQIDCTDNDCSSEPSCAPGPHRLINSYDGPSTCIGCHNSAGSDMLNSVHGSWMGATPNVVNISGSAGKWGQSNNYCTDPEMADYGCLRCHVSLVGPPSVATAADMDCLACHQNDYDATFEPSQPVDKTNCVNGGTQTYYEPVPEADGKYRKHPRYDLMPAGATMIEMARLVHRPDNESCLLICHSDAGGGDGIKRGDLDSAMVDPAFTLDVHLSSSGTAQLTCTGCHVTNNHKIPGRGNDLRPTDATTMKACVDCHAGMDSGGGHASAGKRNEPDRHVARVDCTGCHIKSFGDGIPTEMTRDWTTPKWSAGGCEGQGAWVGTTTKGSGVTPTYRFWTGDSWIYDRNGNEGLSPDPDDNNTLRYSYPIGDINNGKLYPFKVHESMNPVENGSNMSNFDVMQMFFTGCYDDAARDGLDFIGATGAYTWQNTKAYQLITHGIGPAASADDCGKCHGNGRISSDTMSELDKLGYHLKDGDGNGVINDADRLIICSQCHQEKSFKRTWEQMHAHTGKGSGMGCYFCHEFQRPERNLCDACDPACVAEFVDTNPFPHQCP